MNAMEKFDPGMLKIPSEMSVKIDEMFDKLRNEGYVFNVEETPDSFIVKIKDEENKEHGFGFTKVNGGYVLVEKGDKNMVSVSLVDAIEAKIRYQKLGTIAGLEKLKQEKKGD